MKKPMTYQDAGVDIGSADVLKKRLKSIAGKAQGPHVLSGIGPFGGLFRFPSEKFAEPVLVASADGVGTKVLIARAVNRYHSLGLDIVNHCVNDIGSMGARPLFFLDYLAFGSLLHETIIELIDGMADACKACDCALLGGETAEMPDLYGADDFDIAGFIVGVVDRPAIIDGSTITEGDVLIALGSNGLHTNGYSLVRKIFFSECYDEAELLVADLGESLADAFLRPHLSYFPMVDSLSHEMVKGIAHITGGGIAGNLSRILPKSIDGCIDTTSWTLPPLFRYIQTSGQIDMSEMRLVFNCGVGMILVSSASREKEILELAGSHGFKAWTIGETRAGKGEVLFV